MAQVFRIKTVLSGFPGAPGVNTHYFTSGVSAVNADIQDAAAEVHGAMNALKAYLVRDLTWNIDPEAYVYELDTGVLDRVAVLDATGLNGVSTATVGSTSRASMIKLRFSTGTVVNNRRLRGGIYLGPISDFAITSTGAVNSAAAGAVATAYDAMISGTGPRLQVWHRPVNGAGGAAGDVTGVSVMPLPAVLRSRRD